MAGYLFREFLSLRVGVERELVYSFSLWEAMIRKHHVILTLFNRDMVGVTFGGKLSEFSVFQHVLQKPIEVRFNITQ